MADLARWVSGERADTKAIVRSMHGTPGVLRLEEVPTTEARAGAVLVRTWASSVNQSDLERFDRRPSANRPSVSALSSATENLHLS